MTWPPSPDQIKTFAIVHAARMVDELGRTSAVCYQPNPHPIDRRVETWTLKVENVTCADCLRALADPDELALLRRNFAALCASHPDYADDETILFPPKAAN